MSPRQITETAYMAASTGLLWVAIYYLPIGDALFRLAIPLPLVLLQLRQGGRTALEGVAVTVLLLTVLSVGVTGMLKNSWKRNQILKTNKKYYLPRGKIMLKKINEMRGNSFKKTTVCSMALPIACNFLWPQPWIRFKSRRCCWWCSKTSSTCLLCMPCPGGFCRA